MWASPGFLPVTVQVRFTAPVNPPPGETPTGVVFDWPGDRGPLGVDAKNASCNVCPVPLEHPAVQVTVSAAEGPAEVKLVSPL